MPSLTPLPEASETLALLEEGTEALSSLAEASESLTALLSFDPTAALPALYPSAATYPSASGTYPSVGTPGTGLQMDSLIEGTETLIPLVEV